jgi:hypothetical protein
MMEEEKSWIVCVVAWISIAFMMWSITSCYETTTKESYTYMTEKLRLESKGQHEEVKE